MVGKALFIMQSTLGPIDRLVSDALWRRRSVCADETTQVLRFAHATRVVRARMLDRTVEVDATKVP